MKKQTHNWPKAKGFFLLFFLIAVPLVAADLSYDRYAPVYERNEGASVTRRSLLHFLAYPFEVIRWPVDRMLYFTEEYSLDKKTQWAYETIQNHGYSLSANIVGLENYGAGVDVDVLRVLNLKETLPDAKLKTWVDFVDDVRFAVGSEVGVERIAGTGFRTSTYFQYENRPNEHFFGIGNQSSPGDGSVFSKETTTFEGKLGYSPYPTFSLDGLIGYRNINISSGRDGGRGQRGLHPTFTSAVPGFFGDSIFNLGLELVHDTRNQKENSTKGGRRGIGFSYNEGLNSSRARYFSFETDIKQYFRLGSDRRVLALRFHGEHNDEIGDGHVPFHQMAILGGYGVNKHMSETLRAFEYNRFFDESAVLFNVEYRYTIWEYREFKVDTVVFLDEGQVFKEFSDFQMKDFRESYGMGFRLSLANIVLLSIEGAHGDEDTKFYFKSYAPF